MTADQSLRLALKGNAAFSLTSAALMLLAGPTVAGWLGLDAVWPLRAIGVGLVLFAVDLLHQAKQPVLQRWRAYGASAGDLLWVVGTAMLLVGWPELLAPGGRTLAIAVAVIVFVFGSWQWVSARRVAAIGRGDAA